MTCRMGHSWSTQGTHPAPQRLACAPLARTPPAAAAATNQPPLRLLHLVFLRLQPSRRPIFPTASLIWRHMTRWWSTRFRWVLPLPGGGLVGAADGGMGGAAGLG
jgi:hypothetical protein